jgi:hypothetical protein
MQFLAFLKDSYREIKSGWVLLVMLVLAGILLLAIASVGYRPTTVNDRLSDPLRLMTHFLATSPEYDRFGRPEFSIENVTASNKSEPWKSDYSFDFVVTCPTADDMRKALKTSHETKLPTSHEYIQSFLRNALKDYNKVDVEEPPTPPEATPHLAIGGAMLAVDPPAVPAKMNYRVTATGSTVDDPLAWPHHISIFFVYEIPYVHMSLRDGVYLIEKWVIDKIGGWVLLFVGIIITAGFIPNMLAKGSLDLLLSKPIGRSRLFVYKYIGGLTFIFLLTSITIVGFWLIIGLRSGIWTSNFLAIIPILTFYFAILYAVSAMAAMLTRNSLVAILMSILVWGFLWGTGKVNDGIENLRETEAANKGKNPFLMAKNDDGPSDNPMAQIDPDAPLWGFIPRSSFPVFTGIHTIGPRTFQLDERLSRLIAEGVLSPNQLKKQGYDKPPRESWIEMISMSLLFIAIVLGLSCWRFETRDH